VIETSPEKSSTSGDHRNLNEDANMSSAGSLGGKGASSGTFFTGFKGLFKRVIGAATNEG
jgi:hypothetical protein